MYLGQTCYGEQVYRSPSAMQNEKPHMIHTLRSYLMVSKESDDDDHDDEMMML